MKTNVIIDWLAFTVSASRVISPIGKAELTGQWADDIVDFMPDIVYDVFGAFGDMSIGIGRPPYNQSLNFTGGMIAMNPKIDNILVEFTGKGCEILRKAGLLDAVLFVAQERLSRVDLAVDIQTNAMPTKILESGVSGRFKAISTIKSGEGETVYVGSRKSERYLRIYRYHEPHPRHQLLRFEFVYRKQYAKDFASALIDSGFDYRGAMARCGIDFGIEHECWDVRDAAIDLNLTPPNKRKAGTVIWLITSVAPAFRKLVKDDVITEPLEFLQEHFLS